MSLNSVAEELSKLQISGGLSSQPLPDEQTFRDLSSSAFILPRTGWFPMRSRCPLMRGTLYIHGNEDDLFEHSLRRLYGIYRK